MTIHRRGGIAAALTLCAFAFAACGGGTTSPSADGAASPGPSTAPASTAPDGGAPSTAAASPAPSTAVALPSFDLSELVSSLEDVDSYRLTIVSGGETAYSGVVVTKPVLSRDVTMGDTRIVAIGDEVWMGTGDDLEPAPAGMAGTLLGTFDPALLIGAFAQPGAMTGADEVGTEEKNGVQARHYRIDGSSLVGSLASMPPDAVIDIWIAEDGYLVSLAASGMGGGDLIMDVTNVNDPTNSVDRPE